MGYRLRLAILPVLVAASETPFGIAFHSVGPQPGTAIR